MSPNSNIKKIRRIQDESVLKQIEESQLRDDYIIRKSLKYTLLAVSIIVISFIAVVFMWEVLVNEGFRQDVLNLIKENITAIVIAAFGILGITMSKK
jgi:hypothetical protein